MSNLTGTDKSVILLMTIGEDRAAEVLEHLCRPVFANGHQQDDAFICACQVTHDRYLSTGE